QLLVLDERDVRLDAGGVAVHHEGDGAGRGDDRRLGVADAVLRPQLVRLLQHSRAALYRSSGTCAGSIFATCEPCFLMTRRNGSRFFSKPLNGPITPAMRADSTYAWPHRTALMAPA